MRYVDAFVLPVPEKKLKDYRSVAQKAGKVWLQHGALQYIEAVGDDLVFQMGVPFTGIIKPKKGETVIVSFILYKSRAHRDRVNAKVMTDPSLKRMMEKGPMPFDMKRMVYGGFQTIVDF